MKPSYVELPTRPTVRRAFDVKQFERATFEGDPQPHIRRLVELADDASLASAELAELADDMRHLGGQLLVRFGMAGHPNDTDPGNS